jgi:glycerol-3-phosphate dehydrogenase (NAD(P)+)
MKASVIGGGAWGSAFAVHMGRLKIETHLWIREKDIYIDAKKTRENKVFLPGYSFPQEVSFFNELEETVQSTDVAFIAVPSKFCRSLFTELAPFLKSNQIICSLTKGIEEESLKRMSEVMEEIFSPYFTPQITVLSGPSFSKEVVESHPTAVVIASKVLSLAREMQHFVSNLTFRAYASSDIIGVEFGGALKNIIAIAAGASEGLKFGYNSMAALITRGLAEISRLGMKQGAKRETFSGLAGMGDLVLTCTGKLSRNRSVGFELGEGKSLQEITSKMTMVAEGITTARSARRLAIREEIDMPICEQVYRVLYEGKDPKVALQELLSRRLKDE